MRLVAGREKLRRTSVFGTYLPLAIGAIYSGCKASLSFGEWTFSLKVAFTRLGQRDHYPSTGFRRKRGTPWRTLKYAEFTPRSREYGSAAPRWQSAPRAPPIKVAQFRDIASTIPSPAFFREHRNARRSTFQPGTRRKSAPLCHCTALIKTLAELLRGNFFLFLIMPFFPCSLSLSLPRRNVENEDTISTEEATGSIGEVRFIGVPSRLDRWRWGSPWYLLFLR